MVSEGWEGGGLGCFGLGVCASQLGLFCACQISQARALPPDPAAAQALHGSFIPAALVLLRDPAVSHLAGAGKSKIRVKSAAERHSGFSDGTECWGGRFDFSQKTLGR